MRRRPSDVRYVEIVRDGRLVDTLLCSRHRDARAALGWTFVSSRTSRAPAPSCFDCYAALTRPSVLTRLVAEQDRDPEPVPVLPGQLALAGI